MEGGVETGDLRHVRMRGAKRLDWREVARLVKRRERRQRSQLLQKSCRHHYRTRMLETADRYPVADCGKPAGRLIGLDPVDQTADQGRHLLNPAFSPVLLAPVSRSFRCDGEPRMRSEALELAAEPAPEIEAEASELDAGRPGVDGKDRVALSHGGCQVRGFRRRSSVADGRAGRQRRRRRVVSSHCPPGW